jgi:hypothetical protein
MLFCISESASWTHLQCKYSQWHCMYQTKLHLFLNFYSTWKLKFTVRDTVNNFCTKGTASFLLLNVKGFMYILRDLSNSWYTWCARVKEGNLHCNSKDYIIMGLNFNVQMNWFLYHSDLFIFTLQIGTVFMHLIMYVSF